MNCNYPPVPSYVDVSHFRAPYQNLPLQGLGAVVFGDNAPDPTADPVVAALMEQRDGMHYFRPEVKDTIMKVLGNSSTIFLSDNRVEVTPFSVEEIAVMNQDPAAKEMLMQRQALRWVEQKVKQGNVVFATPLIMQPLPGRELGAVPASDKAAVRAAASTPYAAILAEPGGMGALGWLAVGAIGFGLVVGVGAMSKRKR